MITFNVVKEPHGWAIRMGECMMTPFWSKDLAIQEANRLSDAIRCHGESTEVVVAGGDPKDASKMVTGFPSPQVDTLSRRRRAGTR